ncbi:MAG: FAD-binding oxidoreductase [Pseudomonadota bacterium]
MATKQGKYTQHAVGATAKTRLVAPKSLEQLQAALQPAANMPTPIRPMGANSTSTQCTSAVGGTVIDMKTLNRITDISEETVTCEAGVTLRELADCLADKGMELSGALDLVNRTVGGAVASGCFGPTHDGASAIIASQVVRLRVVTADGRLMTVDGNSGNLLQVMRCSFGALGVIYDLTLKIRPIQPFVLKQRKMDIKTFGHAATTLTNQPIGLKCFFLPFKDTVYAELRRPQEPGKRVNGFSWKLKDMGETSVLPKICTSLSRIVPIAGLRYSLVDGLHDMGQSMLTNTLTETGHYAAEFRSQGTGSYKAPPLEYTTWCFPCDNIGMLLTAYQAFAKDYYAVNKYRCDMPVVGMRLPRDDSALLSPSHEAPMFALRFVSSPDPQWEDFAMDLAEFAERWGAVPLLNQSRCAEPSSTTAAFGTRLDFFRKIRRTLDPESRLLNPFLSQYLR